MSYKENIQKLILNKLASGDDEIINLELINKYRQIINDKSYFDFITIYSNGGFFFDGALQFYKFSINNKEYENIDIVNSIFLHEYGKFALNVITIGQDVFGNQFVFDKETGHMFLFNIETAEKEKIADDFITFLEQFFSDTQYYSGQFFMLQYESSIKLNQRLCPKIPFVIGGEYVNENLYSCDFPKYFEIFADIAKQIKSLPDGTPIKLKII